MKKPIMGWVCTYTPEEIMIAAGFHPYRLTPDYSSIKNADFCMPSNFCPFARKCVDVAIEGGYDFLSGIILVNSCHAIEQVYDAWRKYIKTEFIHILDVPRLVTQASEKLFEKKLSLLCDRIEGHFNKKITQMDLLNAIDICNRTRKLMSDVFKLRVSHPPYVKGHELINLLSKQNELPRDRFNDMLSAFIETQKSDVSKAEDSSKKRIMIIGSVIGQGEIIKIVEENGALVVFEHTCSTNRYLDAFVKPDASGPISAIAHRYMGKTHCPRMPKNTPDLNALEKNIHTYKIDAVVYSTLKFCTTHSLEAIMVKDIMESLDIPFLFVEGHYTNSDLEQLKTRISTFVELL